MSSGAVLKKELPGGQLLWWVKIIWGSFTGRERQPSQTPKFSLPPYVRFANLPSLTSLAFAYVGMDKRYRCIIRFPSQNQYYIFSYSIAFVCSTEL